jgi:hypothetical protein
MVALRQKNTRIVLLKRRLVRGVMFRVVITMIVLKKLARVEAISTPCDAANAPFTKCARAKIIAE